MRRDLNLGMQKCTEVDTMTKSRSLLIMIRRHHSSCTTRAALLTARSLVGALLLACCLLAAGCHVAEPMWTRASIRPPAAPRTYIVNLPGMSGETWLDDKWTLGLGDGGVADHLEVYDWTRPNVFLAVLWDRRHNEQQARKIADAIAAHAQDYPNCPIVLTAGSAGCAVAIWALEDLPPGVQVQSVMLVAPAVDPDHDLTRALRHVREHLYSINSTNDWLVLDLATTLFGTADGAHTQGAGLHGFNRPPGCNPSEYKKLVQVSYRPEWARYGDDGGHTGSSNRAFARDVLAPMLLSDAAAIARTPSRIPPSRVASSPIAPSSSAQAAAYRVHAASQ